MRYIRHTAYAASPGLDRCYGEVGKSGTLLNECWPGNSGEIERICFYGINKELYIPFNVFAERAF